MKIYSCLFFVFYVSVAWSQHQVSIPLCGTDIYLSTIGFNDSPVMLYNMHDNENTAAVAGRLMAAKYGGQYFELVHSGERNISFFFGGDSIAIDPNRIYTNAGIWQQMAKNKSDDTLLFDEISIWRDSLLAILHVNDRSLVIALHNNTNKNYSFSSYLQGGEFENEADTTHQGQIRDMDDFYFVTDRKIFNSLSAGRYHVVLQNNEMMTDDGSLSVYCGQLGIRYINVEAQQAHLIRQIKMLIYAYQRLVIH